MNREQVLEKFSAMGIRYEITEHPAAFTIEEIDRDQLPHGEDICKNLFLRDAKGKHHFLVVMNKDKRADLAVLRQQLGSTALSFASEERLMKYLGLPKGAVTPLGILNDSSHAVEVVFDEDLIGRERLGVHPLVNTATVWLSYEDLLRIIRENGNNVIQVKL